MFFRHWQPILLEREDIPLYSLLDIGNRFLLRASLADAAAQAGTFSNPITVFSGVKHYLSHRVPFLLQGYPLFDKHGEYLGLFAVNAPAGIHQVVQRDTATRSFRFEPSLEGALAFSRRTPRNESLDTEVFVQVGPSDSLALAD